MRCGTAGASNGLDDLPVTTSPEHGYRMRARLHVRKGRVGFFREGTHDLCDCAGTGQLLPESVEAVRAFVDATPRAVRDAIDAIELTESIAADERVLHVLVGAARAPEHAAARSKSGGSKRCRMSLACPATIHPRASRAPSPVNPG